MANGLTRFGRHMAGRVMQWTAQERTHAVVVLVAIAVYGAHTLVWCWPQPWFIEDSAISFSYARNLVLGDGLVPFPGGERVEGYSNALWMFLLAGFYLIRLDPWVIAKVLGFLLGAATLPVAYLLVRRARPGPLDAPPLLAPPLLAASTQFVLWNTSGLENSLFSFLLAAGTYRLAKEIQDADHRPWSAALFFLLSMTRPEGTMYAAIAVLARLVGTVRRRQWLALPTWIVAFLVPFLAYQAARYSYFGWEFPNTYYAKERNTNLLGWASGGWKQFREYAAFYLVAYTAPIVALGLTGWERWRKWVVFVLALGFLVLVAWNGREGLPGFMSAWWNPHVANNWGAITVWFVLGASVVLGILTLLEPGWEVRSVLWASWCAGVFFWVWSGVEWMKGYRWASLLSGSFFPLLALGLGVWFRRLPLWSTVVLAGVAAGVAPGMPGLPWEQVKPALSRLGYSLVAPGVAVQWVGLVVVAALLALLAWWFEGRNRRPVPARPGFHLALVLVVLVLPDIAGSWKLANSPETSPNSVHRRVNYMKRAQERLGLEHVTLLDVDMGAHMWWAKDWTIGDMAGLVDVPMAHHKSYPKAFVDDYVFEQLRPDFAHVHGAWAKTTKIPQNPKWQERYVEIPGYPSGGRTLHVGNFVRRDHLMGDVYQGPPGRRTIFSGGVVLEGWEVPAPVVAAGGRLYVSSTWRVVTRRPGFRVLLFLSDAQGHVFSAEVSPGYDWYRPDRWGVQELVYGRWSVPVPESLAPGTYRLGFVLLDEPTGAVLGPLPPADALVPPEIAPPEFMYGELLLAAEVVVGNVELATEAANRAYEAALGLATGGDCEGAATAFYVARQHLARNETWYRNRKSAMDAARVGCLIRRSEQVEDRLGKAALLAQAHRIDARDPALVIVAEALGAELEHQGDEARAAEQWEEAYRAYEAALSVEPTRAVARRKAEEARNRRLGLDEDGREIKPARSGPASRPPPSGVETDQERGPEG